MVSLLQDLLVLVAAVVDAIADDDQERVQDILPGTLRLAIAQEAAKARARAKFGPAE